MELVKTAIRVGNSAGVLLPKEYLNSEVKIVLTPLNIEKDVLNILLEKNLLQEVIGVYILGSYARKEQSIESDIDILVITSKTEKRIKKERYDLLLIKKETLEEQLKNNFLPLFSMIKEAIPIVNKDFLIKYKHIKINKKKVEKYLDITKSGARLNRAALNVEKEIKSENVSDAIAYSLILHLRSWYIVNHLLKDKLWNNKGLINLIKKITGSKKAYEGYLRTKLNKKRRKELPFNEAEKLYNYLIKKIKEHEKWLKIRKK